MMNSNETNTDDDISLLDSGITEETREVQIVNAGKGCSAKCVIELLVLVVTLLLYPTFMVCQQYSYDQIASEEIVRWNISNLNETNRCLEVNSSNVHMALSQLQQRASYFMLLFTLSGAIPAGCLSILLGHYSDKAGRKLLIVMPLLGLSLGNSLLSFIVHFGWEMYLLFLVNFLNHITGGVSLFMVGCFSFITDTTIQENRVNHLIYLTIITSIPLGLSSLTTGYIIDNYGFTNLSSTVAILYLLVFISAVIYVPESVPRLPGQSPRLFDSSHIKEVLQIIKNDGSLCKPSNMAMLLIIYILTNLGNNSQTIDLLYVENEPLCWNVSLIGVAFSVEVVVSSFGALLMSFTLHKCGCSDSLVFIVASLITATKLIIKAFVKETVMFFALNIFIGRYLLVPILQTSLSNNTDRSQHGGLFAVLAVLDIACNLVSHLVGNILYAVTQNFFPGLVYIVFALSYLSSAALMLLCLKSSNAVGKEESNEVDVDSD